MYEVEMKFPLSDSAAVLRQLVELGAVVGAAIQQCDTYLKHPARDFSQTDEAFRIRSVGEENYLTYKGPRVDSDTKTRREIELPCGPGTQTARQLEEMFVSLGFQPVRQVLKQRVPYHLSKQGCDFELAYDSVDGLGNFLEIELLAKPDDVAAAQQAVRQLARELGLANSERRSYLSMLLEQESHSSG